MPRPPFPPAPGKRVLRGTGPGTGAGCPARDSSAAGAAPSRAGRAESQAASRAEKAPQTTQPGDTHGRAAHPAPRAPPGRPPSPARRPAGQRRRLLLTCRGRRLGPHLGGEAWGPDSAADASGWGAPGSAAAASPGLRGSGGQSRHPHRLPQEVGPPLAIPSRPARLIPPPAWPRPPAGQAPLSGARLRSAEPEHHREGRAPPVQRGLCARARPLAEPSCRSPSRARRGSPGVGRLLSALGALVTHLYAGR